MKSILKFLDDNTYAILLPILFVMFLNNTEDRILFVIESFILFITIGMVIQRGINTAKYKIKRKQMRAQARKG